jgi:hypothetical protein
MLMEETKKVPMNEVTTTTNSVESCFLDQAILLIFDCFLALLLFLKEPIASFS